MTATETLGRSDGNVAAAIHTLAYTGTHSILIFVHTCATCAPSLTRVIAIVVGAAAQNQQMWRCFIKYECIGVSGAYSDGRSSP